MPQSTRKNRNDNNPPEMPPLNFAAAGVSGFGADNGDHFSMNNNGYPGFPNAFSNASLYSHRSGASHPQNGGGAGGGGGFNHNPFGMTGFAMTAGHPAYSNYSSYAMPPSLGGHGGASNLKRAHSDNPSAHQHASHPADNAFGAVSFQSDPSISFISPQTASNATAGNTNPYTQSGNASSYGDTLSISHSQSSVPSSAVSRAATNTNAAAAGSNSPFDAYTAASHSSSDLFGAAHSHPHSHRRHPAAAAAVLNYAATSSAAPNGGGAFATAAVAAAPTNNYFGRFYGSQASSHSHSHNNLHHNNNAAVAAAAAKSSAVTSSAAAAFLSPLTEAHSHGLFTPASATTNHLSLPRSSKHHKSSSSSSSSSHGKLSRSKSYSSSHHGVRSSSSFRGNKSSGSSKDGSAKDGGADSESFPFPIQSSAQRSKLSKVTGVARISLQHNPPVHGCSIESHVILATSKEDEYVAPEEKDCKYVWYRSQKRMCFVPNCSKPALLQCLSCCKVGVDNDASYYCSPQCMKQSWLQHKQCHPTLAHYQLDPQLRGAEGVDGGGKSSSSLSSSAEVDSPWAQITNAWKVRHPKHCQPGHESPRQLCGKFPPPMVNKWEKIRASNKRHYEPTSDDIGRQLLLQCTPIFDDTKTAEKTGEDEQGESAETSSSATETTSADTEQTDKTDDDDAIGTTTTTKSTTTTTSKYPRVECRDTSPCLPRPQGSSERAWKYYHGVGECMREVTSGMSTFRVMTYNTLAPIYCTQSMYPYVEPYQLSWDYRKYNIIREIVRYAPDIICLQEVQKNHFHDYFLEQLGKKGYGGMFHPKTRKTSDADTVDGCCIFFKKKRFKVVSRYHIDFNDTSKIYLNLLRSKASGNAANNPAGTGSSSRPIIDEELYTKMTKRLLRGNIALIVAFEEIESSDKDARKTADGGDADQSAAPGEDGGAGAGDNVKKKESINMANLASSGGGGGGSGGSSSDAAGHSSSSQSHVSESRSGGGKSSVKQVCIATTHVFWDPSFTDVKLWQSWILCEEISRALGPNLPLILCGDFNSDPKSAVYEYLTRGRVESTKYAELSKQYDLLPPQKNLQHRLSLKSHYNHNGKEPSYTNYTRHFKGCLDYILYSKSIEALGYLQEYSEAQLLKEDAFPNIRHSSDHIPLVSTFAFASEYQSWSRQRRARQAAALSAHKHSSSSGSGSSSSSSSRPVQHHSHQHHRHHHAHSQQSQQQPQPQHHYSSSHNQQHPQLQHQHPHHAPPQGPQRSPYSHSSHQRSSSSHRYHSSSKNDPKSHTVSSSTVQPPTSIRPSAASPSAPRHQRTQVSTYAHDHHHGHAAAVLLQPPNAISKSASGTMNVLPRTPPHIRRHHSLEASSSSPSHSRGSNGGMKKTSRRKMKNKK